MDHRVARKYKKASAERDERGLCNSIKILRGQVILCEGFQYFRKRWLKYKPLWESHEIREGLVEGCGRVR